MRTERSKSAIIKYGAAILLLSIFACSDRDKTVTKQNKGAENSSRENSTSPDFSTNWLISRGSSQLTGRIEEEGISAKKRAVNFKLLWAKKIGKDNSFSATPVIKDKNLFIGGSDGSVYALSCRDGKTKWNYTTNDDSFSASAAICGDKLFIGSDAGILTAVDISGGSQLWEFDTEDKIAGAPNISMTKNRPAVIFGSYDNNLYALNTETGRKIWSYKTDNFINGTPAVSDKKIIFGGCDGKLRFISTVDGKEISEIASESYIPASPAVHAGRCFVALYSGELISADIKTGKKLWSFKDEKRKGSFTTSPAVTDRDIIIGSKNRYLYSINTISGKLHWQFRASSPFTAAAVIFNHSIIAASNDGTVYLLDPETGELINKYETGETLSAAPAISGNTLFIASEEGTIYAIQIITK